MERARSPRPRLRTLLIATAVAAGLITPVAVVNGLPVSAAVSLNDSDVTANLWEWNWNSVASACTNHLGPAGYGAVQVAPPQESVALPDHPWWEVYQPVSYKLESRFGTRRQFAAMTTACHNAGVRVFADAVVNHMAGTNNTVTTGYAGSSFSPTGYSYPAVPYENADFHHPGSGCPTSGGISDWNNEEQVTECELVSLSDLYTEKDEVRTKIVGFLNDLIGLGVDGFRVDAVKHIKKADFAAILGKVNNTVAENKRPYVAQEIFDGAGNNALKAAAFTGNGDVLDFAYAKTIKSQFEGSISNFADFSSWTMDAPSDKVFAMVVNHDLERDGVVLSYKNGDDYKLANYFALAWPHGRPSVYDSFTWSNRDQSPPANGSGYVTDTNCTNGAWTCNTQTTAMKGMVGWHNATAATRAVSNFTATSNNVIGFSRGSLGWVGINDSASASTATYPTGLADGAYCDVITGGVTASACAGTTVTVSAGRATVTIPANNAVAIHINAKPGTVSPSPSPSDSPETGTTEVTFKETATTVWGTNVYLVGSIAELGSWNPAGAIALSSAGYPVWSVKLALPKSKSFEYKYIKKDANGAVTWESGSNRSYSTGTSSSYTLNDTWK